jgi:hypothetical protein
VLQQKRREDALKLRALRAQIKAGLDEFERGDFTEVAGADLDEYLEALAEKPGKASRCQKGQARMRGLNLHSGFAV